MNVTTGTLCSSKPEAELEDQGALPPGWILTTLGEAFVWGSGGTPKRSITEYFGGCIPWAVIGDLKDGIVSETSGTITNLGLANSSARMVPAGSVLLAMYGSIGKLGIAGTELTTNQAIAFTKTDPIHNRYLFWYLRFARGELVGLGRGDTQSNISQTVIKGFPFLLAPLPEQRRIVAEIEKHFTRLDAAEAALRRVEANLKRYRASVLKAACEGKLVPTEAELAEAEGRDYEHAEQLLGRILAERRACWESQGKRSGKYKEPAAPETRDLPDLPDGWVWTSLSSVGEVRLGRQRSPKRATGPNMRPYLRAANVTWDGLNLSDVKEMDFNPREFEIYRLMPGDILLNEASGSPDEVGKPAVWRDQIEGCCFQNTLIRVRAFPGIVPFLFYRLLSDARSGNLGRAARGVGIHHLGAQRTASWTVALPPLEEQLRIVAEIEQRLSVIQQAETTVEANLKRVGRLRQSILLQAFCGRLVPQDPEDEPASVLLERIRAERESSHSISSKSRQLRFPKEKK